MSIHLCGKQTLQGCHSALKDDMQMMGAFASVTNYNKVKCKVNAVCNIPFKREGKQRFRLTQV